MAEIDSSGVIILPINLAFSLIEVALQTLHSQEIIAISWQYHSRAHGPNANSSHSLCKSYVSRIVKLLFL